MERILLIHIGQSAMYKSSGALTLALMGGMFVVTCEKLHGTGDIEEAIIPCVLTVSRKSGRKKTAGK